MHCVKYRVSICHFFFLQNLPSKKSSRITLVLSLVDLDIAVTVELFHKLKQLDSSSSVRGKSECDYYSLKIN